jgi:chemotaxis regulatin CheY-phosphate phosphatase CheZ
VEACAELVVDLAAVVVQDMTNLIGMVIHIIIHSVQLVEVEVEVVVAEATVVEDTDKAVAAAVAVNEKITVDAVKVECIIQNHIHL